MTMKTIGIGRVRIQLTRMLSVPHQILGLIVVTIGLNQFDHPSVLAPLTFRHLHATTLGENYFQCRSVIADTKFQTTKIGLLMKPTIHIQHQGSATTSAIYLHAPPQKIVPVELTSENVEEIFQRKVNLQEKSAMTFCAVTLVIHP